MARLTAVVCGTGSALALAALPSNADVSAEQVGDIVEFSAGISPGARPDRIISAGGKLWFADTAAKRLSAVTTGGVVSEFNDVLSGPAYAIAAAGNGEIWALTSPAAAHLDVIRPDGSNATSVDLTVSAPRDLVAMPGGDVLMTSSGASLRRYDQTTHAMTAEYTAPAPLACVTQTSTGFAYSDHAGSLHFMAADGVTDTSSTVTTNEVYRAIPCQHTFAEGSDKQIWSLLGSPDSGNRGIRRTDPLTKAKADFNTGLTTNAGLTSIALGPDGAMWFTERAANKIGRIAPDGTITEYPVPSADAGPADIVAGPDGAMWFTEHNGGRIGRIAVTDAAAATTTTTAPPPPPAPTGTAPAVAPPPPVLTTAGATAVKPSLLVQSKVPRSRSGLVPFALTCLSLTTCDGTVKLTIAAGGKRRAIARTKVFSIKPGAIRVHVRLTNDGRRRLRRAARGLKATAMFRVGDATQTLAFTLKGS